MSEKYDLACKKFGYDWGRENRLPALCVLRQGGSQYNASDFEGIYVPFFGADELDFTDKIIASVTATADVRTKLLKDAIRPRINKGGNVLLL